MFEQLTEIHQLIETNQKDGRNQLIQFLGKNEGNPEKRNYEELINHLLRLTGLYPYMSENAHWLDELAKNAFMTRDGQILHREQSDVLKKILEGKNIIVSAPTSFGKTFIIETFLSIKSPNCVVIIVPTIALMDEMRRKMYRKFKNQYKIITNIGEELAEKNIFIFPQERVFAYLEKFNNIGLLVVDEFYKVSKDNDKDRYEKLQNAIVKLGKISSQKYFLAPNITNISDNPITQGMDIVNKMDFQTVFLNIHDYSNQKENKNEIFTKIIKGSTEKTLIYAGTFPGITELEGIIAKNNIAPRNSGLIGSFINRLEKNYTNSRDLLKLLQKGFGLHNGRLHRSIAQIQIKLFEEEEGLQNIISTSSIIEGVNTSAKNVIIRKSKLGKSNIKEFTYKNIIGRGGRMFKYFIGEIYLLDKSAPQDTSTQLNIEISDSVALNEYSEGNNITSTQEHRQKIIDLNIELNTLLGNGKTYNYFLRNNKIQYCSLSDIKKILQDMNKNPNQRNGWMHLNNEDYNDREWLISKIFFLMPGNRDGIKLEDIKIYIKIAQHNRSKELKEILSDLAQNGVYINKVFEIEKFISNQLAPFFSDVSEIYNYYFGKTDSIKSFIVKISNLFLPPIVYVLEEYGLPRVLSKKIQNSGIINLENNEIQVSEVINQFSDLGIDRFLGYSEFDEFDKYIIKNFFDGI